MLDDVVLHGKDVVATRDTGKDLAEAHPETRSEVSQTTDDIEHRYAELEGEIGDRMRQLQRALSDSQSIQDSLDDLLKWLQEKETLLRLLKARVIVVKKEPLVEHLQEYRLLEKDIENHRPTIESVIRSAEEAKRRLKPDSRDEFQNKVDDFQKRFGTLTSGLKEHGEVLQGLSQKLVDLEKELDRLEEWLMPFLDEMESSEFNKKEMPELERRLQVG